MRSSKSFKKPLKKVFISGTNGLTAQYGGWDQLIRNVSELLTDYYDVICHGSFFDANSESIKKFKSKEKLFKINANGISSIFFDFRCLLDAYLGKGICLMIGTSGGIFFPIFKILGLKIVVNPDGYEWKRTKWNKFAKLFLFISDYLAINFSDVVICDHPVIQDRVKRITKTKTFYIPYGGDNAKHSSLGKLDYEFARKLEKNNYFFKVCRIEPENSIHLVIKACISAKVNLVIVGNWSKSKYGKRLKEKYGRNAYSNIFLIDPIYDPVKLGSLRSNCLSYIHGHTVGGTNPSLVEAMWLGLDIIAQKNEFNQITTCYKATYFTDQKDLEKIISYKSKKDIISKSGDKMREIALKRYTHKNVSLKYLEVLKNL